MSCEKESSYLFVWFYSQTKKNLHDMCSGAIINIIVTKIDPPFCHVELAFEDGMAISVTKNNRVFMRRRTFDPLYYTCVRIPVSLEVSIHAKSEAISRIGQKFGFFTDNSTFCSKLVADILKLSTAVNDLGTQRFMSPSALYNILIKKGLQCHCCKTRGSSPVSFKHELAHLLPITPQIPYRFNRDLIHL